MWQVKVITGEINRNEESLNLLMTNTPIYPAYMNRKTSFYLGLFQLQGAVIKVISRKEEEGIYLIWHISLGIEVQKWLYNIAGKHRTRPCSFCPSWELNDGWSSLANLTQSNSLSMSNHCLCFLVLFVYHNCSFLLPPWVLLTVYYNICNFVPNDNWLTPW